MGFRIGEQLFVMICPETNQEEIKVIHNTLEQRLNDQQHENLIFNAKIGFATHKTDATNVKDLVNIALERLNKAPNIAD